MPGVVNEDRKNEPIIRRRTVTAACWHRWSKLREFKQPFHRILEGENDLLRRLCAEQVTVDEVGVLGSRDRRTRRVHTAVARQGSLAQY